MFESGPGRALCAFLLHPRLQQIGSLPSRMIAVFIPPFHSHSDFLVVHALVLCVWRQLRLCLADQRVREEGGVENGSGALPSNAGGGHRAEVGRYAGQTRPVHMATAY